MVNRRQVLAGVGLTLAGAAGKTGYDNLTDEEAPEVDASFTGVEGDIEDWRLTGEIFVQAGSQDAEVTGYIDDRVQVKQEELSAGEEETYNLSVEGQELGNSTIEALVRAGGNQHRDREEFNIGMEDLGRTGDQSNNGGGSDGSSGEPDYQFGDLEEQYLEESSRSRNRFEGFLEEFSGFIDELTILESGNDYFLDREDGDLDQGALGLDKPYSNSDTSIGFTHSFAEDLYDLSKDDSNEFTDFLGYVEEGDSYN